MMLHIIKNFRTYPHTWFPRSLSSNLGWGSTSTIRFCTHPDNAPNKTQNPSEKATEEGYATRSDEKGFEGGGNQSTSKIEMDRLIHENHPAYDKTQVSEAKENVKARH